MLQPEKTSTANWRRDVFLFAALIAVDQCYKVFTRHIFLNRQFAFSLPVPVWLMYLIYFVVLYGLVYFALRNYRNFLPLTASGLVFIFAGALSNLAERILLGYVRDWIYISFFRWTGIYNLADGYIILGIIILLFGPKKNPQLQKPNTD